MSDGDFCDVLYENRHTVRLSEDDVFEILDLVAFGQIVGAAVINETHPPNVDGLLTDIDVPTPDIDVGVVDGADQLRDRDAIGVELVAIDLDFEFLGRA